MKALRLSVISHISFAFFSFCLAKVVVVSANFTLLSEWERTAAFKKMLPHSALALMNVRTQGGNVSFSAYVPISSSTYLPGNALIGEAFQPSEQYGDEQALQVYRRRYGRSANKSEILHLGLLPLSLRYRKMLYPQNLGFTGELLQQKGIKVAALGNADTTSPNRAFTLLGVNQRGTLPLGAIGQEIMQTDSLFPYGKKIGKDSFERELKRLWERADLLLIELGDFVRLRQEFVLFKTEPKRIRNRVFRHSEALLLLVLQKMNSEDKLLFFSAYPPESALSRGNRLGFVVLFQRGASSGLLTSQTTRIPGFTANVDIPATLLSFFSIPTPPSFLGSPMEKKPHQQPLSYLKAVLHKEKTKEQWRVPLITFFLFFETAGFLFLLFCYFTGKSLVRWNMLGILMIFPAMLLFFPLFPAPASFFWFVSLSLTILFFALFWLKRKSIFLLSLYPLLLFWDLFHQSQWMRFSPLGFSITQGFRYYGLGNEYMGILIFGTLLLFSFLRNVPVCFLIWLCVLILLSLFGANFGGVLVQLACGAAFFYRELKTRKGLFLAAFLFVAGVLMLLLEGSHVSRFFVFFSEDNLLLAWQLILRKLGTNIRILHFTRWANFLWVMAAIVVFLWIKRREALMELWKDDYLRRTLLGILSGSLAGFLLNDSGVVVAATGFFALNAFLFYHLDDEQRL